VKGVKTVEIMPSKLATNGMAWLNILGEKEVVIAFMYSLGHIGRQWLGPKRTNYQKRNFYLLLSTFVYLFPGCWLGLPRYCSRVTPLMAVTRCYEPHQR